MTLDKLDISVPSGTATLLEACAGQTRQAYLQDWLAARKSEGAATWYLDVDIDQGGPWSGVNTWLMDLLQEMWQAAPDLIAQHDYELAMVLPHIQHRLSVRNPNLTDLSSGAERTRNYAADRAYRVVHGLIELLSSWHERSGAGTWCVALDGLDCASTLVQMFFAELLRRRGAALSLAVLAAVEPGAASSTAQRFVPATVNAVVSRTVQVNPVAQHPAEYWTRRALELERAVGDDSLALEEKLPQLIAEWSRSDRPERAVWYRYQALSMFTTRGLYADALRYGEAIRPEIERQHADPALRLGMYIKLYNCYIGLGKPEQAFEITELALKDAQAPEVQYTWQYLMAMLYARYSPERDLARAEHHLELGLQAVQLADVSLHTQLFQTAFNRNGLAMIRNFQGRRSEALYLCQTSLKKLDAEFDSEEHKLHRSVLLYNIAQVYDSMQEYQQAIFYYTAALKMDPNYSEYYNERGSVHLRRGQLEQAERDYRQAIALSPPYAEVWTNLGQCYALMGDHTRAVQSYSRALDLMPTQLLAILGRAQSHDAMTHLEAALADYTAALALDGDQALVWANRASILYQLGRSREAVADLDQALILDPDSADLQENRQLAASVGRQM